MCLYGRLKPGVYKIIYTFFMATIHYLIINSVTYTECFDSLLWGDNQMQIPLGHLQTKSHKRVFLCILYKQWDATYIMFFIIINALHVSGGPSAHHQEPIKLYVQPWVLSCFPAVYCWCGGFGCNPSTPAVDSRKAWQYPRLHIQFYKLLMMGGKTAWNT